MLNQIQLYCQEYFKQFLELIRSPSCPKQSPCCLQQGLGQTLKPYCLNSISWFTKNKSLLHSATYTPNFKYEFHTPLGKVQMFSASKILSLLETLEILTWRHVFTPQIYITNSTGPAVVPDQLLMGNPVFRMVKSQYLQKRYFYMLNKITTFPPSPKLCHSSEHSI